MINPDELTDHGNENNELLKKLDERTKDEKSDKELDPTNPLLLNDCYGPQYVPIVAISSNNGDRTCNIPMENQTTAPNDLAISTVSNGNLEFNQVNSILPVTAEMPITTQPTSDLNIANFPTNFTNSPASTDNLITNGDALTTNISDFTTNIGDCGKYTADAINSNDIMPNSMPKFGNDPSGDDFLSSISNWFCIDIGNHCCHMCWNCDCSCPVDCCSCLADCGSTLECCCCCCDILATSCDCSV